MDVVCFLAGVDHVMIRCDQGQSILVFACLFWY